MRLIRKLLKLFLIVLVVVLVWSTFRAGTPATAFRRQIIVNVPPQVAWDHFSRPEEWRSWLGASGAPTSVTPPGEIGPNTTATFGNAFTFRMTEFAPYDHWMWSGALGWLTLDYDHIFEPIGDGRTRMVFHQTVTGFGNDVVARLLGLATGAGGHQDALNRLADEINSQRAGTSPDAAPSSN